MLSQLFIFALNVTGYSLALKASGLSSRSLAPAATEMNLNIGSWHFWTVCQAYLEKVKYRNLI